MKVEIRSGEEYIKLGQLLKKAGLLGSGVDAKMVILDGLVFVNNEIEQRRGRKLYEGDIVSYDGETIEIIK
ncbi:MAG: RNA-binding S4 domain-containing protein [Lachnospiraceae bacterium]